MLLLTIDAGNTNTVLGVFEGTELRVHWRLTTRREQTADEYGILVRSLFASSKIEPADLGGVVLASVVPPLTPVLIGLCRQFLGREPVVIEPGVRTGMPVLYDPPRLAENDVPTAAAIYAEDLYVPRDFSEETAARVHGLRPWLTNEYEHDALRSNGQQVLGRLFDLVQGRA